MEGYQRLVTLYGLQDLYIVQPLLDAEEIDYYIKNERFVQLDPLSSVGAGGMDILIRDVDLERARTLLLEAGYIDGNAKEPENAIAQDEPAEENPEQICPFCGSGNVKSERTKIGMLVGYFTVGFPLPLGIKIYRCFNCRKLFDKSNREYRFN